MLKPSTLTLIFCWASCILIAKSDEDTVDLVRPMVGKFELISDPKSDEYDQYLQAMEYSEEVRGLIRSLKTILIEFSVNGKTWTHNIKTRLKNMEIKFESGKEFDDELFDGRKCKSIIHVGEKRVTRNQEMGTFLSKITYDFTADDCKVTFSAKEKTAKLEFKRIKPSLVPLLVGRR